MGANDDRNKIFLPKKAFNEVLSHDATLKKNTWPRIIVKSLQIILYLSGCGSQFQIMSAIVFVNLSLPQLKPTATYSDRMLISIKYSLFAEQIMGEQRISCVDHMKNDSKMNAQNIFIIIYYSFT